MDGSGRAGHLLFTFNSNLGLRQRPPKGEMPGYLISFFIQAIVHRRACPAQACWAHVLGSSTAVSRLSIPPRDPNAMRTAPLTHVRHSRISFTSNLPIPAKTRPSSRQHRMSMQVMTLRPISVASRVPELQFQKTNKHRTPRMLDLPNKASKHNAQLHRTAHEMPSNSSR